MTHRGTTHAATLLTASLLLLVGAPVQADHDPVHTARQVADSLVAPTGTPLPVTITIRGEGAAVAAVFHSAGLSCTTTDDTVARVVDVECVPAVEGDWVCLGPAVIVTVQGGTQGSITGSSGCAETSQTCTAYGPSTFPHLLPACLGNGLAVQDFPVFCQADYSGGKALGAWRVTCTNGDP